MAIVKGVNERVHLPLYDSIFVRPARQLREIATSNVLRFFVNIQGKTKLETNMQSSSLLPHWNTFEARALRVVISDLPAIFPDEIEQCRKESNGNGNGGGISPVPCPDEFEELFDPGLHQISYEQVEAARQCLSDFTYAAEQASEIREDLESCLGILRRFCDPDRMEPILKMQSDLRSIRSDLAAVLSRTRVSVTKSKEVSRFLEKVEELGAKGEELDLLRQIQDAKSCLDAFCSLADLASRIKEKKNLEQLGACVAAAATLVDTAPSKKDSLYRLKECLLSARAELYRVKTQLKRARSENIKECLNNALGNKLLIPIDEQLAQSSPQILAKLIYNSVTTLFVGEKIMIQMPTWFFPAGAGPYSEDGQVVTHGFPTPQATFNFAEPVFIDTQQNFRVEIEFPESEVVERLHRIYGPFFIWVVLDGYMTRDVQ